MSFLWVSAQKNSELRPSMPRHLPGIEASTPAAPPARRRSHASPPKPITGPAPKVRKQCCPRSLAFRSVFFHHSHALPSILAWAQDCSTQSWRGRRIAPPNPGVWAQDCRCLPENIGSAVLYSAPRLAARVARKKNCVSGVATQHCADTLAARLPGFKFGK